MKNKRHKFLWIIGFLILAGAFGGYGRNGSSRSRLTQTSADRTRASVTENKSTEKAGDLLDNLAVSQKSFQMPETVNENKNNIQEAVVIGKKDIVDSVIQSETSTDIVEKKSSTPTSKPLTGKASDKDQKQGKAAATKAESTTSQNNNSETLQVGNSEILKATVKSSTPTSKPVTGKVSDKNQKQDKPAEIKAKSTTSQNNKSGTLQVGKTETLKATVKSSTPTSKPVTGKTSDKNEKQGKSAATKAESSISLNKKSGTLQVGKTETLKATVKSSTKDKKVKWSSSDKSIATVSTTGVVKAIAPGIAVITATTSDGVSDSYRVEVKIKPVTLKITAKAQLAYNNHVGNTWGKQLYIDDQKVSGTGKVTVVSGDEIIIHYVIWEDDKKPDVGSCTLKIKITPELMKKGTTIHDSIIVYENGGRYSGNSAKWNVTITIKP